jgi:mono/diheme cytochrome c family protein
MINIRYANLRNMPFATTLIVASVCIGITPATAAAQDEVDSAIPAQVQTVLNNHCVSCHGETKQKGKVRLDNLATLSGDTRNDLLNKIHEALHFEEMPPQKAKQPTTAQRKSLSKWVAKALAQNNASKLEDKLRRPDYGNYVDHDKLFSGEHANEKAFTHDRRWLISEFIFDAKFNRILRHSAHFTIDGKREYVKGSNNRRVNLTNPFLLPTNTGVRYYANETLNGGHLLTMMTNAKEAATYMIYLAGRDSRYLPAINAVMAMEDQHNATLASRKSFLNTHIERVLKDLYAKQHEALLPSFTRVKVPAPIANDGKTKKAPFHAANPGAQELTVIFRSMRRHQQEGPPDTQLIEKCEREWFNLGHNQRTIQARITFLNNYMVEWRGQIKAHRYDERNKPHVYRPKSDEEMKVIHETIRKHRKQGDRYNTIIEHCLAQWEAEFKQARMDAGPPKVDLVTALVEQLFIKIHERSPLANEVDQYVSLSQYYITNLGNEQAIKKLIQTLILRSEFVYRNEFGQGEPDKHGRRMLSPRDASYALAYALTDSSPDEELVKAAKEGRLKTREDYKREVLRLLSNRKQFYVIDESVNKQNDITNVTNMPIREFRFFREFFGYQKLLPIFKDNKRFGANYNAAKQRLVTEADRLVEHIVENDKDVFNELLTTDKFYVYHSGDNESMQASADRIRQIYNYFKDKGWQDFTLEDLIKHKDFIGEMKMRGIDVKRLTPGGRYNPLRSFKTQMTSFTLRLDKGQTAAAPYNSFPAHGMANASSRFGGRLQSPDVARFYGIDMYNWDYQPIQPAKIPHRKGMLTHPAWLIAHAQNTETDPIHRGKWIQEKLLAGTIPDVPITVDAAIPQDPHKTLRQRMDKKTKNEYCWTCHQKMNPLGLPFEMFDDFGRYRTQERLEYPENLVKKSADKGGPEQDLRDIYKTLPVVSTGYLEGTGNSSLDGEVNDAIDLIERLAKSDRVRQSIIRYAFRYFMGRNEFLTDSKTLIDADKAYISSGGSFDAVIVSLLTSDSFMYRKAQGN